MVKRLNGRKNPLKELMTRDQKSFIPRIRSVVNINKERFYVLENVQR